MNGVVLDGGGPGGRGGRSLFAVVDEEAGFVRGGGGGIAQIVGPEE